MAVGKEMEILGVGGWLEHTGVRRAKEMAMVLIAPTVYLWFVRCLGGLTLSWHLGKTKDEESSNTYHCRGRGQEAKWMLFTPLL